jgi:hypothetical protein
VDVFLIFDSKMHYSVIGAPSEIVEKFEKRVRRPGILETHLFDIRRPAAHRQRHGRREVGAGLSIEIGRLGLTSLKRPGFA